MTTPRTLKGPRDFSIDKVIARVLHPTPVENGGKPLWSYEAQTPDPLTFLHFIIYGANASNRVLSLWFGNEEVMHMPPQPAELFSPLCNPFLDFRATTRELGAGTKVRLHLTEPVERVEFHFKRESTPEEEARDAQHAAAYDAAAYDDDDDDDDGRVFES
jgi:hypothetical protein